MTENNWTLVAQFPPSWNPENLLAELQRRGINHRIVREEQRQSLWVEQPEHIVEVGQLVRQVMESQRRAAQDPWSYGAAPSSKLHIGNGGQGVKRLWQLFRQFPVVMWGILLSLAGALLVELSPSITGLLLFPFYEQWSVATLWRWLTPIFLHFGVSHVVFNCLWLWVFGSRLEQVCGSGRLLMIVVATGLGGNIAQYLWSQSIHFGGMSGVVYGLMGYLWLRQQRDPHPLLVFPPMLFAMMFVFLVLGMTGTLTQLFGTGIANAAHLGGLLTGLVLAMVSAPKSRR
ncbi:rhomboid family intramembrane serine protease [Porticoccus sp. GXU_MW_L64]